MWGKQETILSSFLGDGNKEKDSNWYYRISKNDSLYH